MNKIDRIKTALSDGSCSSVYIRMINSREIITPSSYKSRLLKLLNSKDFRSIEYNLRTYSDLGIGDTVYTPDGEGCVLEGEVINVFNENPIVAGLKVRVSEKVNYYFRYELILLEKAEKIDMK